MAYIGNQSTNAYSSLPAKQDLTGATGDSLTLSHAVAGPESIDLFINNVRQEPTTAYSVSDTTVTLTGSVVASDDIYVVYNGLALQTIVPPDGSVSTAKIADDAVTSAKLDTNIAVTGDLTVDTNTLHVDSTNNSVGVGTSSPIAQSKLTVAGNSLSLTGADADFGAGGVRGMLDLAGGYLRMGSVNGGGSASGVKLVTPAGGEAVVVDSNGVVMVSRTSAYADGAIGAPIFQCGGVAGSRAGIACIQNSTAGVAAIGFVNPNGTVGSITTTGTSTSYLTSSDHRLKENVTGITGATDRLKQLNPVRFNFIADADTTVDGFLAHEVADIVPEAISGEKDAVDDDGNAVYQSIDQSKLVPLLVATIREQQAAIEALTARVTALEAE